MFGFSSLRCIDCLYLDKKDRNRYGEFYCPEVRKYVSPDDRTCKYFIGDFYVMAAYSAIKGLDFDNEYVDILTILRNTYMRYNEEGQEFLTEYESIGPEIARRLLTDMYRVDIVNDLEKDYILPAVESTLSNDLDVAQQTYMNMVESLKIRYGYSEIPKIKRL